MWFLDLITVLRVSMIICIIRFCLAITLGTSLTSMALVYCSSLLSILETTAAWWVVLTPLLINTHTHIHKTMRENFSIHIMANDSQMNNQPYLPFLHRLIQKFCSLFYLGIKKKNPLILLAHKQCFSGHTTVFPESGE